MTHRAATPPTAEQVEDLIEQHCYIGNSQTPGAVEVCGLDVAAKAIIAALAPAERASEPCDRCQGNGEIITDDDRYLNPREGDKGDEAVADCPDCDGTGHAAPAERAEAVPEEHPVAYQRALLMSAITRWSIIRDDDVLIDAIDRFNATWAMHRYGITAPTRAGAVPGGWTGRKCERCNGTGENGGESGRLACSGCGGTGEEYGPLAAHPPAAPTRAGALDAAGARAEILALTRAIIPLGFWDEDGTWALYSGDGPAELAAKVLAALAAGDGGHGND